MLEIGRSDGNAHPLWNRLEQASPRQIRSFIGNACLCRYCEADRLVDGNVCYALGRAEDDVGSLRPPA